MERFLPFLRFFGIEPAKKIEPAKREREEEIIKAIDPLLEGGEFTAEELEERSLASQEEGESGRKFLLRLEVGEMRFVPKAMLKTASSYFKETNDIATVLRYLRNGFFFYRNCVKEAQYGAPHLLLEGACEWPSVKLFPWTQIDSVVFAGELAHDPAPVTSPLVSVIEGSKKMTADLFTGEVKEEEVALWRDQAHKTVKFQIEKFEDVRFIYPDCWQIASLRFYADSLGAILMDLENGKLKHEEAGNYLQKHLERLTRTIRVPVARYLHPGEATDFDIMLFSAWEL